MTVHEKMGCKYRILSGDAMLILAYQYFEQYEPAVLCDWQNCLVKRR
jgi:geranylgeranyl diphosphate synthase type II